MTLPVSSKRCAARWGYAERARPLSLRGLRLTPGIFRRGLVGMRLRGLRLLPLRLGSLRVRPVGPLRMRCVGAIRPGHARRVGAVRLAGRSAEGLVGVGNRRRGMHGRSAGAVGTDDARGIERGRMRRGGNSPPDPPLSRPRFTSTEGSVFACIKVSGIYCWFRLRVDRTPVPSRGGTEAQSVVKSIRRIHGRNSQT